MSSLGAIIPHLQRLFTSQRIVFWHDPVGEYKSDLETLDLDGVHLIRVQGNEFWVKSALLAAGKDPADEITVKLVTKEDNGEYQQQHLLMLKDIQDSAASFGIQFAVTWDDSIHDRSISTDNGWEILLGRGLDIFQKGSGGQFDLGARRQEFRQVAAFGITYIRDSEGN